VKIRAIRGKKVNNQRNHELTLRENQLVTFLKELEDLPRVNHEDTKAQRNYKLILDMLHIEIEEPELYL